MNTTWKQIDNTTMHFNVCIKQINTNVVHYICTINSTSKYWVRKHKHRVRFSSVLHAKSSKECLQLSYMHKHVYKEKKKKVNYKMVLDRHAIYKSK